ncbi:unnamed protein product, partial [Rotaria sp. Silwood2]
HGSDIIFGVDSGTGHFT